MSEAHGYVEVNELKSGKNNFVGMFGYSDEHGVTLYSNAVIRNGCRKHHVEHYALNFLLGRLTAENVSNIPIRVECEQLVKEIMDGQRGQPWNLSDVNLSRRMIQGVNCWLELPPVTHENTL